MTESQETAKSRAYRLDRITHRELLQGYFRHAAVITYLVLLPPSVYLALTRGDFTTGDRLLRLSLAAAVTIALYPLAWYLLHRYVLHSRFLYRSSLTAALWKRIHFDHHQDPHDLQVLFGAPRTTLPTMAVLLLPIGYAIGGVAAACGAFATGLVVTLVYEYFHCIQHLAYTPGFQMLRRIKRLHLLHHFHNESGNFGISNYFWDRVGGTYYDQAKQLERSETVRDLGYAGEERVRYPWVAELTEGISGKAV